MHEAEWAWNDFVEKFLELKEQWELFQAAAEEVEHREDLTTAQGQKIFGLATRRSKFDVAVPRLLDHARRGGGLESLLIKEEETDNG